MGLEVFFLGQTFLELFYEFFFKEQCECKSNSIRDETISKRLAQAVLSLDAALKAQIDSWNHSNRRITRRAMKKKIAKDISLHPSVGSSETYFPPHTRARRRGNFLRVHLLEIYKTEKSIFNKLRNENCEKNFMLASRRTQISARSCNLSWYFGSWIVFSDFRFYFASSVALFQVHTAFHLHSAMSWSLCGYVA